MRGLPSLPKAALIAVGILLSAGAGASYADVAQQLAIARGAQVAVHPAARAEYLSPAPSSAGTGKCIGGYMWTQRSFNVHRTENQMALPMACR